MLVPGYGYPILDTGRLILDTGDGSKSKKFKVKSKK